MRAAPRRRALLLAPMLPRSGFWGRHQRYSLLGRALGSFADVDALVFLRDDVPRDLAAAEAAASEEWGTRVRLHVRPATPVSPSPWRRWLLSPVDYRRQPALRAAAGAEQVAALEERLAADPPDLVVAFGIEMMQPLLASRAALPPVHLDMDDVPHVTAWRTARVMRSPLRRGLLLSQLPGLLWVERRATAAARRSYVASRLDRDYLSRRWRLPRMEVLPNAVRIREPVPDAREPSLLFIGQLAYLPNAEAARFLIDEVWPRVHRRLPEARLRIVGPSPEALGRDRRELPAGVDVTGTVEDLEGLYASTAVACAPIRAGSGTRIKILEAAAFGRPVVSTRLGAEGLELCDGREIRIRDGAAGFSEACCALLSDPEESRRLGGAARRRVSELYEISAVLGRVRGLLDG